MLEKRVQQKLNKQTNKHDHPKIGRELGISHIHVDIALYQLLSALHAVYDSDLALYLKVGILGRRGRRI